MNDLKNQYDDVSYLEAKDVRHVLIEHINKEEAYVPNDISLNKDKNGILLYGTNAVGKSSLIKSIGISVILAQSGMFVPCSEFIYYPYKSIFTRILGNDNIFKGHKLSKDGKPHPYIFKWYACAYIILAIIVTYLEYDNWFG